MIDLYNADCLEGMKLFLDDNSVDALVTDPPAGINFMGKEWDSEGVGKYTWIRDMTMVMKECKRVLKPGAHGLVWAIPRTSHWTATALENAGFEVRDVITHLFGSGFPKSLNISKAIDKAAGAEREVVKRERLDGKKTGYKGGSLDTPIAVTPEAKKYDGYGTALKPSSEHWILIRKPISEKTVAANVLKWGTGGLNIDKSRIATEDSTGRTNGRTAIWGTEGNAEIGGGHNKGRFPANTVLSGDAPEMLDQMSGELKNGGQNYKGGDRKSMFGNSEVIDPTKYAGDTGGASRFFYVAKPSKKEKGKDNIHPTVKPIKLMAYLARLITPKGGTILDPFMGSGTTGIAAKQEGFSFIGLEREKEYFEIAKGRLT